ncbi:hypothetical protein K440DRAFT_646213 [Wilcoxina mikolae CBS 423.85]|nr:hypothetical protein K440DRAFT_646213 [Wilcoxina mikolae CBS 423.85]
MSYSSTAGIAVQNEAGSTFDTKVQDGIGFVHPTNTSQLEGRVYFSIPYPPNSSTATDLHVNFASTSATIVSINIYYDGDCRFSKNGVRQTQTFVQNLKGTASSMSTDKEGICVALGLKFSGISSNIEFLSCGITFA